MRSVMKKMRLGCVAMAVILLLCGTMVNAEEIPMYKVRVNRATNYVAIYTHDSAGVYNVPVMEFTCSTGKNNLTPVATTKISYRDAFHLMNGGVYSQFATRFNKGCMFHAVPSRAKAKNTLVTSYFNKLGEQASSGCVRLTAADAKWIFDNCRNGTEVEVFDDPNDFGPFGKPMVPTIPDGHPYANWDPTDPDPKNPWINERPVVKLVANAASETSLTLPAGSSYDALYNSVGLFTPEGEAYAAGDYGLDIYGAYDLNTPGTYQVYLRGHDLATTLRGDLDITLTVN